MIPKRWGAEAHHSGRLLLLFMYHRLRSSSYVFLALVCLEPKEACRPRVSPENRNPDPRSSKPQIAKVQEISPTLGHNSQITSSVLVNARRFVCPFHGRCALMRRWDGRRGEREAGGRRSLWSTPKLMKPRVGGVSAKHSADHGPRSRALVMPLY